MDLMLALYSHSTAKHVEGEISEGNRRCHNLKRGTIRNKAKPKQGLLAWLAVFSIPLLVTQ